MQEIYELELRLLSREVRSSPEELDALLADGFVEIGSSGRLYTKDEIMRSLPDEAEAKFIVSDFAARPLSTGTVLATYKVEKILAGGSVFSFRSSIWYFTGEGWQMIFHQGTMIDVSG